MSRVPPAQRFFCCIAFSAFLAQPGVLFAEEDPAPTAPASALDDCYKLTTASGMRAMATVLRNPYLLTGPLPSDLMLRCGERTVDVALRQDAATEKVKTSDFTAESQTETRTMEAAVMAGGESVRYGLQLEKVTSDATATLRIPGSPTSKETVAGDGYGARLETGVRYGDLTAGLFLKHVSLKNKKETPVAGTSVATTGKRLAVTQPGASVAWSREHLQILAGRVQGAEATKEGDQLRLPWTNVVRVIQVLEQDQGIRGQFERSGAADSDSTAVNRGLLAYFLTIDNATMDVAWFGRSSSYKSKDSAVGGQLATFGFTASAVWAFSRTADVYGSLHSLSANDSLGGADKRTAHRLVTGGNLGLQVVF